MKKRLIGLLLAPTLALATPVCDVQDPNFCSCFVSNAIKNCLEKGPKNHVPRALCKEPYIKGHIHTTPNIDGFCTQYEYMFPEQSTHEDCVSGVSYAKAHC